MSSSRPSRKRIYHAEVGRRPAASTPWPAEPAERAGSFHVLSGFLSVRASGALLSSCQRKGRGIRAETASEI